METVKVTDKLLSEIVQKILAHFQPLKIILFGSYVWGSPNQYSDVDMLIIIEGNERPAIRANKIRKVCRPDFLPMDIIVRTPEEIEKRLGINDIFIKE